MTQQEAAAILEDNPIIAAVKSDSGLERCLAGNNRMVFILYGNILTIPIIAGKIKDAGKIPVVHLDLIEGLSPREAAVDFLLTTQADGVISTRPAVIKYAKSCGLLTIQRFFLLDSMALETATRQITANTADFVEVLPGGMPKVISVLCQSVAVPIIAGGLIRDKEDVCGALSAGAIAVSSTNEIVWFL